MGKKNEHTFLSQSREAFPPKNNGPHNKAFKRLLFESNVIANEFSKPTASQRKRKRRRAKRFKTKQCHKHSLRLRKKNNPKYLNEIPYDGTWEKCYFVRGEKDGQGVGVEKNDKRVYCLDNFLANNAFENRDADDKLIICQHHKDVIDWNSDEWRKNKDAIKAKLKFGLDVARGEKRGAKFDRYVLHGMRKEPLGCDIGPYSMKKSATDDDILVIDTGMQRITKVLHDLTNDDMMPKIDNSVQSRLRKKLDIPAISGCNNGNVQFSIGKGKPSTTIMEK